MSNSCIYDFNKFVVDYSFSFILKSSTPISIGGSSSLFGVDNAIIRLRDRPYIPGSSLKGTLRSNAERIARSMYGDDESIACNILDPNIEKKRKEAYKDNYQPCIICEIFGGSTRASRLKVYNAELIDSNKKLTETIRRVAIDRITGAQSKGRLFDIEYLVPTLEFKWSIRIENIELLADNIDERSRKVIDLFNLLIGTILHEGIEVGGKRSVGFGVLKVKRKEGKEGEIAEDAFRVSKYTMEDEKGIKIIKEKDVTNEYRRRLTL
ncbi:MAG: RAMP superfamily CRISPR-associated protein [Candidatus Nitrosocaldus sp.]|nr:RAMP superfamily CRISPR-associated protein [Candidatus Nitrosocaldus sp.]MDW8275903.1 RAMP superfamily CRISPR-associated protein [Candidatus Nitrosocaldus sp.]